MSHGGSTEVNAFEGFDYRNPGSYLVTFQTNHRRRVLGEIKSGKVILSRIGEIADRCWREIPDHHEGVGLGAFQIMPDHIHGIVVLRESPTSKRGNTRMKGTPSPGGMLHATSSNKGEYTQREYILSESWSMEGLERSGRGNYFSKISPKPGSLSTVIRSFKSVVTKQAREETPSRGPLWQSGFHDRIIRDDRAHYFIERYVRLNPLIAWFRENSEGGTDILDERIRAAVENDPVLTEYSVDELCDAILSNLRQVPGEFSSRS